MESTSRLDQYLTKTQLHEQSGRHRRTLTGDICKAIADNDEELLRLAQIRDKEDNVIEGVEVTANTWREISERGGNPEWYFLPAFVEVILRRKKRKTQSRAPNSKEEAGTSQQEKNRDSQEQVPPPMPTDTETRAIVLEHLHFHNKKHDQRYQELTNRVLELVENNQKLQGKMTMLIEQFQPNAAGDSSPVKKVTALPESSPANNVIDVDPSTDDNPNNTRSGKSSAAHGDSKTDSSFTETETNRKEASKKRKPATKAKSATKKTVVKSRRRKTKVSRKKVAKQKKPQQKTPEKKRGLLSWFSR